MIAHTFFVLAAAVDPCAVPDAEVRRQHALPYVRFDTGESEYAWRSLNGKGCADAAVRLLGSYASAASGLTLPQRSEIAFHQGQALAFAGRDQEFAAYFTKARQLGTGDEWTTYIDATLAFLRKDQAALQSTRDRYARLAGDSMRLLVIDGFIACPTAPYAKAVHCKM